MKKLSVFASLAIAVTVGYSQEARVPKGKMLRIVVVDSVKKIRYGYLAAISDSAMIVLNTPVSFNQRFLTENRTATSYQGLSEVRIQRKGSVGKGMLIGAISGLALGLVVAAVDDSFDEGLTPLIITLSTAEGAAIGALIGALWKKTFKINGNKEKFIKMKNTVLDMTYGHQ